MSPDEGSRVERAESGVKGRATAEEWVECAASEASLFSGVARPSAEGFARWLRDLSGMTGRMRGTAGWGLTAPRKAASLELAEAMSKRIDGSRWMERRSLGDSAAPS